MIRTLLCVLALLTAAPVDNPTTHPQRAEADTTLDAQNAPPVKRDTVIVRQPDPREADAYLSASRFDYGNRVEESESLFQRIMRNLFGALSTIPRAAGPLWDIILWGVFAVVVIFAVLRLLGADFSGVVYGRKAVARDAPVAVTDVVTDYESAAGEAEQAGDYRAALRWRYVHLLAELDASGQIALRRDKTNERLAHEIRNPNVRADFDLLTSQFEASWYGAHFPDQSRYQDAVSLVDRIRRNTAHSLLPSE